MATLDVGRKYLRNSGANDLSQVSNDVFEILEKAYSVARERRQLLALEDHELKDIGISRADAEKEGNRAFWDMPR